MDGDGSIQVNHWRYKNLQYRLIIKLKFNKYNYNMLLLIKNVIGGNVNIIENNTLVIWIVNNKKDIINIIKIFDDYPLLTSRKQAQLNFLILNLEKNDINWYLNNRELKYQNLNIIASNIESFLFNLKKENNFNYIKPWLSGFIEAEGCFCLRNKNNHSFSIGQNNDLYLLEFIKFYFNASNKIRTIYKKNSIFFFLEIYKKSVINNILNHFYANPLLGEKYQSYLNFLNYYK